MDRAIGMTVVCLFKTLDNLSGKFCHQVLLCDPFKLLLIILKNQLSEKQLKEIRIYSNSLFLTNEILEAFNFHYIFMYLPNFL